MQHIRRMLSHQALAADLGLLVLRLGIGLSLFLFHGWGKISAGPERWARIGASMGNLGIDFAPTLWGFLAAFAESIGSVLLVLGLLTRPAASLIGITMFVAAVRHLSLPAGEAAAGWKAASHAIELLVVCAAVVLVGPGRLSLDRLFTERRPRS